ncbi:unnamed protein product [Ceratitis capitata]|uniref:(Mediterranean fruit fly) hypothetical protein n=1 Tax=Ceratitis capitata TaxID=7213 RepID=A0A811VCJ9_CERCA|nr:unnamed protein product [Ceratitis capitata]
MPRTRKLAKMFECVCMWTVESVYAGATSNNNKNNIENGEGNNSKCTHRVNRALAGCRFIYLRYRLLPLFCWPACLLVVIVDNIACLLAWFVFCLSVGVASIVYFCLLAFFLLYFFKCSLLFLGLKCLSFSAFFLFIFVAVVVGNFFAVVLCRCCFCCRLLSDIMLLSSGCCCCSCKACRFAFLCFVV